MLTLQEEKIIIKMVEILSNHERVIINILVKHEKDIEMLKKKYLLRGSNK